MTKGKIQLVFGPLEVCEYLGISKHTLTRYRGLGLPTTGHGKYDLTAAIAWYVQFRGKVISDRITGTKAAGGGKNKSATERLAIAKADKAEQENAISNRELVSIHDVETLVGSMATITANNFEALGPRLAPILAGIDDPAEIQATIREETLLARKLIADKIRKFGIGDADE